MGGVPESPSLGNGVARRHSHVRVARQARATAVSELAARSGQKDCRVYPFLATSHRRGPQCGPPVFP